MPPEELRNSLKANHRLHWYLVDRVLGQGGFGITYLAHDPNLDQYVAVKEYLPMELAVRDGDNSVYPASEANGERYRWGLDRFISEARTLAKFKHPAIVRVLSVFEENNTAYMVMEYERGESFQQVIDRRRTLPEHELLQIVGPLLDGLEVIHASGFIHRDIKPANIYIRRDGSPVLLDFGSARQALGEQTKSLTSIVSPGYAPFEQYYSKSDKQGPWTDIYSLAATLYRAITGLMPMDAIDRSEAILKAEKDAFISAEVLGAGKYSPQFLRAIDNGLHFSEKKRPQTVNEWRQQLGVERVGSGYSQRNTLPVDIDLHSKTRFDAPSSPVAAIQESQIETQIATRVQGESLEPQELPEVSHSVGKSANASTPQTVVVERGVSWPKLVGLSLLIAFVVAGLVLGVTGSGNFIDNIKTNIAGIIGQQESVDDLVAKGDRALAAGKVFEPYEGSAFDYYRRAAAIDGSNPSARQGIDLTIPEVQAALDAAISTSKIETAERLLGYLTSLPYRPIDVDGYANAISLKRAEAVAGERDKARVNDFLKAADEDIEAGRLVSPAEGNALSKFRAVLLLDPKNAAALAGIEQLTDTLKSSFAQQLADGQLSEAKASLAALRNVIPEEATIGELSDALVAKQKSLQAQQSKAAEISDLLRLADEDLAASRLASPRGRNAIDRYQKVLELDSENERASAGLRAVADKYVQLANNAINSREPEKITSYLSRLNQVAPDHSAIPSIRSAQRELSAQAQARQSALALEQERIRLEEQARVRAAEQRRLEIERAAQLRAEEERRARQEAEAKRLFEEEEARAQAAKAEQVNDLEQRSSVVVEFDGFDDQLELYGLRKREVRADIEATLKKAGYIIKLHHEAMRIPESRLVIIRFRANLNSASGVFSYASSIALYDDVAYWPLDRHRTKLNALWERGNSGVAIQTELTKVRREYQLIIERLVHEIGQAPRLKG